MIDMSANSDYEKCGAMVGITGKREVQGMNDAAVACDIIK